MSDHKRPSRVQTSTDIRKVELGHVWRDAEGDVFAAVWLGYAELVFSTQDQARAVAQACAAAARDMKALEAQPSLRTLPAAVDSSQDAR